MVNIIFYLCSIINCILLFVITIKLDDIERHHRGLKIFLERWFKKFKGDN